MTTRAGTSTLLSVTVALGLAIGLPALAATAEPIPGEPIRAEPTPAEPGAAGPGGEEPRAVSLRGPFGTVAGGAPASPAVAAPDHRALDTWQREATLELIVDPPLEATTVVTVEATPTDGGEAMVLALEDGRWLTAPGVAGEHVVVATIVSDGRVAEESAWLLMVPDRPGDIETLLTMPAVEASLTAASGTIVGERGHGCYIDMCQEVGHRPPVESLEPLDVAVGEPLTLGLDDGSAIAGWQGRLEPQPGTAAETRLARAAFEEPMSAPVLMGLEPDKAGEWLLELRTDFDRERGWQWYLFRLVAE